MGTTGTVWNVFYPWSLSLFKHAACVICDWESDLNIKYSTQVFYFNMLVVLGDAEILWVNL